MSLLALPVEDQQFTDLKRELCYSFPADSKRRYNRNPRLQMVWCHVSRNSRSQTRGPRRKRHGSFWAVSEICGYVSIRNVATGTPLWLGKRLERYGKWIKHSVDDRHHAYGSVSLKKFVYSFRSLDKLLMLFGLFVSVCEENNISQDPYFRDFELIWSV